MRRTNAILFSFPLTFVLGACTGTAVSSVRDASEADSGTRRDAGASGRDGAVGPADVLSPDNQPETIDAQGTDSVSTLDVPEISGENPRHSWVRFEAGTFEMGSPPAESCREMTSAGNRAPWRETQHTVTLTRPFVVSVNEVTFANFESAAGYRPADAALTCTDDECPVAFVTWSEAAAYCNALTVETPEALEPCYACTGTGADVSCESARGFMGSEIYACNGYRLPTEAEFERAYRAGSETAFFNNVDVGLSTCDGPDANLNPLAWYRGNSGLTTHPVGEKAPNAAGLYDMAGNVWNWCHDWHETDLGSDPVTDPVGTPNPPRRVVRGGSYFYFGMVQRAANRSPFAHTNRSPATGIRCVRTVD